MDRTKEPGAIGEPLYEDVCTALTEALERNPTMCMPAVYGGRFSLTPCRWPTCPTGPA